MARPTTRVVWDPSFLEYDFGAGHPMSPIRLDLTARLCTALGLFDHDDVEVYGPGPADDALLTTVHTPQFVVAVKAASQDPARVDLARGLGTEDVPTFVGMHPSSARVVQGSYELAQAVWQGQIEHGVNFCGGLHHAAPDKASGFCVYNDIAVAIRGLLAAGAERVAYIDVDVHHGDGVEAIFWDDPRVLTASIHESGRALFPGTGWPSDIGGSGAQGSALNVAMPPGAGDGAWLRAFHSTIVPVVRAFAPQVIVSQHGCDTHAEDPLAHMALTVDAQREAQQTVHELAHELCEGRWLAVGGGGYAIVDVVPRAWSHLTGIASHRPVDPATPVPQAWRDHVETLCGEPGPARMTDLAPGAGLWWRSWDLGYDPSSEVDRAIMATRQAVFPYHGLDIWFD